MTSPARLVSLLLSLALVCAAPMRSARAQSIPPADDPAYPAPTTPPSTPTAAPPPRAPAAVAPPAWYTPTRYRVRYEKRRLTGLMIAGIATLGGTYFLTAVFGGYVADNPGFYIPLLGPVLYKAPDRGTETALVFDTLTQAAGLAMLLAGALVKVPDAIRVPVTLLPMATPGGGYGLAAFGRF